MVNYKEGWLNAYPITPYWAGAMRGYNKVAFVFHETRELAIKHQSRDILYRIHVRLK